MQAQVVKRSVGPVGTGKYTAVGKSSEVGLVWTKASRNLLDTKLVTHGDEYSLAPCSLK